MFKITDTRTGKSVTTDEPTTLLRGMLPANVAGDTLEAATDEILSAVRTALDTAPRQVFLMIEDTSSIAGVILGVMIEDVA